MDKGTTAAIIVGILVLMLGALALGWWGRAKRQSGFAHLPPVPADLGDVRGEFEGLYLATTPTGDPLNRVVVRGLAYRERTTVTIADAGVVMLGDRFIPTDSITGATRASYTIDRGVEPDGLSVLSWMLGDAELDSYFRLDDPEGFLRVAGELTQNGKK